MSFPVCSAPGENVQRCNAPTCFKYNVAVMLHLEPGSASVPSVPPVWWWLSGWLLPFPPPFSFPPSPPTTTCPPRRPPDVVLPVPRPPRLTARRWVPRPPSSYHLSPEQTVVAYTPRAQLCPGCPSHADTHIPLALMPSLRARSLH